MEIGLREEQDHLSIELEIKGGMGREKNEEVNVTEEIEWKWKEEKKEKYQNIIKEKQENRREKEGEKEYGEKIRRLNGNDKRDSRGSGHKKQEKTKGNLVSQIRRNLVR